MLTSLTVVVVDAANLLNLPTPLSSHRAASDRKARCRQPSADPKTFGSGKNDTVLSSPTRKEREELERRSEFFPARERAAGECHGSVGLTGLSRKRLAGLRQDLSFLDHYGQEEVASIYFFPNQIGKETP